MKPLYAVTICALLSFTAILGWYAWLGGSISSRLGFAIFMSLLPALVALLFRRKPVVVYWGVAIGLHVLMIVVK